MSAIQPLLIALLGGLAVLYWTRLRSRSLDRFVVLVIAAAAIVLVSVPELSTSIARRMGVGRGTDLVLYLSVIGIGFLLVLLFTRLRQNQRQMVIIARHVALREAADRRNADSHTTALPGATTARMSASDALGDARTSSGSVCPPERSP